MAKGRTALLAGCLLLAGCVAVSGGRSMTYRADDTAFPNPLIGYAPGVRDAHTEGTTLRYLGLSWREVEPEEGQFAWETLEQTYGLSELRQQGVHLVLRFFCDEPGREAHLDIPDWLYAKTGDGSWYENDYGSGYSPNYANAELLAAHETALRALGEFLGGDGFVSYVELGSLGHWGEWHIRAGLVPMPEEAVRDQYAAVYQAAFPNAKLLMRRPFRFAAEHGLGLYNDMTGHPKDTEEWLGWIANGGWYGGEPDGLLPMPEGWKTAPIGGELTSSILLDQLLTADLDQTVELIKKSHMSFLGPKIADPAFRNGYETVQKALGYRLRVERAGLKKTRAGVVLTLTFCNDGTAPFYWDWPVQIYLEEGEKTLETIPLDLDLKTLLPGESRTVNAALPGVDRPFCWGSERRITLGIVDPMTGADSVRFAMKADRENGRTVLFEQVG